MKRKAIRTRFVPHLAVRKYADWLNAAEDAYLDIEAMMDDGEFSVAKASVIGDQVAVYGDDLPEDEFEAACFATKDFLDRDGYGTCSDSRLETYLDWLLYDIEPEEDIFWF